MKDSFLFSRDFRIRKSSDFRNIYKLGNKISGSFYTAFFLPAQTSVSRLGVVVSKRVGNAVVRNRQKRIVKEAFRVKKEEFHFLWDLVVVVNRVPRVPERGREDLQGILAWLAALSVYSD